MPPSALIISTVRSASFRSRSATSTLAPARASRIAAARPLPMPSPAAPPPEMIATLPARPASSSGPFIVVSLLPIPIDAEAVALRLDVARIGAGEVGGAEQRVALDAILEELAPGPRRHLLIPAELARPVGMIDLDRVMHDVAGEGGRAASVPEVDGDRARRVAGIVFYGEQRVGLVVTLDHHGLAGLDDRQHRIVERAVVHHALALRFALVLPVRVLALGEEIARVGEGRHPAAVDELGVPADMIDMQMRAHHEVDRFGRAAAGAPPVHERRVELVPGRVVALLVVAEASVDQDRVLARLHHPGVDGADETVGARVDVVGQHPALLGVKCLLIEPGEHAVGPEARGAELLALLDRGATDFSNRHGASP